MKTKDLTIYGIILGLYFAYAFIPFSHDIPIIDFILAYFLPYLGAKKVIELRLILLTIPFALRFPDLWGFVLSLDYEHACALLPVAFVIATLEHFFFILYFNRFLTKRRVPFRY